MELNDELKKEVFPSERTYSDICDAYVELGAWRIPLYYGKDNLGITTYELYETTLLRIEDVKEEMRYRRIPIPVEVIEMQHKMALEIIKSLETQRDTFEDLISNTDMYAEYKLIANGYLDEKHEDAVNLFKKYIIQEDEDELLE